MNRWQETNSVFCVDRTKKWKERKYVQWMDKVIRAGHRFGQSFYCDFSHWWRWKMAKMRTVTRTKRDNGVTADRITPLFLQRVARKNSKIELRFRKFVETEKDATWATWAMTLARHRWHQLQECLSPYSVENNHYVKSLRDTEWRLTIPYIILLLLIPPIKLVF